MEKEIQNLSQKYKELIEMGQSLMEKNTEGYFIFLKETHLATKKFLDICKEDPAYGEILRTMREAYAKLRKRLPAKNASVCQTGFDELFFFFLTEINFREDMSQYCISGWRIHAHVCFANSCQEACNHLSKRKKAA